MILAADAGHTELFAQVQQVLAISASELDDMTAVTQPRELGIPSNFSGESSPITGNWR